jgi:formate C-acetyltransferase
VTRREALRLASGLGPLLAPASNEPPDRVRRLRDAVNTLPPREICFERAILMTESFRQSEGEPMAVRRAKAFHAVIEGMTLHFDPWEPVAGATASKPRVPYFAPENFDWRSYRPDGEQVLARGAYAGTVEVRYRIPPLVASYWSRRPRGGSVGHFVADYGKVLRLGFAGLRAEIEERRREHSRLGTLDSGKAAFYEAAGIACHAAELYGARYARLAREMASGESDPGRRRELESVAAVCERVPSQPARTFREALQSFWFTHVLIHLNSPEWSISPGRFDQYLWPYYRGDIEQGRLTRAEALELLACLWIKFNEVRVHSPDPINYQNLMLGGTDAAGADVTNDLTWLCLEATDHVRLAQPSVSLRWHPGTPPPLLERACRLILSGGGFPALFNDLAIVPAFVAAGVPVAEARDYAIGGCEEPSLPGRMHGATRGLSLNAVSCLLKALGRYRAVGPADFGDILGAYRQELRAASERGIRNSIDWDRWTAEQTPHPFASLLFDDCLARGLDIGAGGVRYNITSNWEAGTITAANSLLAVRKAVFEDRVVTFSQLLDALEANFEGHEELRGYLLERVPKFGNDVEEADLFARRIVALNHEVLDEIGARDYRGGRFFTGSGGSTEMVFGLSLGATPDGRLKGQPVSQDLGPAAGTDRLGVTALLNSVARIDWSRQIGGSLTPVKLPFTGSQGGASVRALGALIRVFFGKGGMGLHFTVVDAETLRKALKDPERHLDLLVRVGGFSAPFVLLSPEIQQEILERTEQRL